MNSSLRILHLEDNPADAALIAQVFFTEGFTCDTVQVDNKKDFISALQSRTFDLILSDFNMPGFDGSSALQLVQRLSPKTPFIFVSGTLAEDLAIDSLKSGATDYVLKHRLQRLGPAVRRALRESESRLQQNAAQEHLRKQAQLLDLANDSIIVRDLEDRITYWNRGAQRLFGWAAEEALNQNVHTLLRSEFPFPLTEIQQSFLEDGHWEGEIVQRTSSGATLTVSSRWTLQKDNEGNPEAILEISNDITERQHLEAQFLQSQKMESVGRLAGGVAHDFNNLLTVIIGRSYLLMNRLNDEKLRKDVDLIQKTADRAAALTRQLLAFSRRTAIRPRVLDLNVVVSNMDKMLRRLIGEDIEIATCLARNLDRVKADPSQIEQIIMNLVVNARDAMSNGGKLTIETANVKLDRLYASRHMSVIPGPYTMLAVTDTGIGMDAETRARVFEPFFTTKQSGTGLGLSTVYGIVKQAGGNVWVYSEPGVGTTFKVYLPTVSEPLEEAASGAAGQVHEPRGEESILLVEDEEAVREIIRETLHGLGYKVVEARHGADALQVAEQHAGRIDLLVTDIVMPGMNGRELSEALRKARPGTKVLYMSGYTDATVVRPGMLDSGTDFLQKPFTQADVARRVREILDRS